jgi:MarR family transcriptional regulator for hemolysin
MEHLTDLRQQTMIAATLVTRAYRRQADLALESCGVSEVMAWPVLVTGRRDGLRQVDLAELLGVEGASLVRTLDRVEAAGLIERREHAPDRRAKTLHLTAPGRKLHARIEQVLADLAETSFEGVSDADMEACLRVFGQVEASLIRQQRQATEQE